jgi:hypothetical protein
MPPYHAKSPARFASLLLSLPLAVAWCAFGFGAAVSISRADGEGAPPSPPVDSNLSSQNIAVTPAVQSEKPTVLPKFEVNGLRERLDAREKIIEKPDTQFWAGFMRLDNGVMIDNIVFFCKYQTTHPNELARFVMWQGSNPVISNEYHYGIGEIADSRMIDSFLVYTSGDDLHVRHTLWGDRIYGFYKASQIYTLTENELRAQTKDMISITQGFEVQDAGVTHQGETPQGIGGDDPNLQVYYAEKKLKEVGMTAFVVPATDRTGPNNDLMLIFGVGHNFYVWRPYYGAYHLATAAYAKLGIKEVANAATH